MDEQNEGMHPERINELRRAAADRTQEVQQLTERSAEVAARLRQTLMRVNALLGLSSGRRRDSVRDEVVRALLNEEAAHEDALLDQMRLDEARKPKRPRFD